MASTESIYRRPAKGGDEVDAFSPYHRAIGFRSGVRAKTKARHNRRVRREGREAIRGGRF
jgi:hypothetical protein